MSEREPMRLTRMISKTQGAEVWTSGTGLQGDRVEGHILHVVCGGKYEILVNLQTGNVTVPSGMPLQNKAITVKVPSRNINDQTQF